MADPYVQLFTILLTLRDLRDHFRTYSANDIKSLIKRASTGKKPKPLKDLYILEQLIHELRETFSIMENSASVGPQDPASSLHCNETQNADDDT